MDNYNQQFISRASTSVDYVLECTECQEHNNYDNLGISNACMLCAEFTPKITTYNYFDFIALVLFPLILIGSWFLFSRFRRR